MGVARRAMGWFATLIYIREMLVLTSTQLLHNPHSHVCETYMHETHTHLSGSCVGIGWGL
jgi:hypothetical protein